MVYNGSIMKHNHMKNPVHLKFAVLATDVALFTVRDNTLLVRLISVNRPPFFVNQLGLPGGLIDPRETAEEAVKRHIEAKALVSSEKIYIEQLYTFSEIERDPRGRVVAVAYLALVPWGRLSEAEQSDENGARWIPVDNARNLAYDHDKILLVAENRLRSRVTYTTLMSKLLPKEFTLTEMEQAYESVAHTELDKRNFRKKILKLKIIQPLHKKRTDGAHRPAELYKFTSEKVKEIEVL
jgi:8-oxo-dGTP diphosphatase